LPAFYTSRLPASTAAALLALTVHVPWLHWERKLGVPCRDCDAMLPLQSIAHVVHRLLAEHHPADFPPSLFIHTGRSMLDPATEVAPHIRTNVLQGVLGHLGERQGDAAMDHADLIGFAVSTLRNRGEGSGAADALCRGVDVTGGPGPGPCSMMHHCVLSME
jgi:hypothetical protein